jgi:hypothetical protein
VRIVAFIIALLLLAGTVEATQGWFIALTVLTGLAALRPRPWAPFVLRPALDLRLAAFVLAALFSFDAIEAERDWLIALAAVMGVAAFWPGLISLDNGHRHERRWRARVGSAWAGDDWS